MRNRTHGKSKLNIIFDLDGTLIDSKLRLYNLFSELVPLSELSFDSYWNLKRRGIGHEVILKDYFYYTHRDYQGFQNKWLSLIESSAYLALDTKINNVHRVLEDCNGQFFLHLCTARQLRDAAISQLKRLDLHDYFVNILVTENKISKSDLIRQNVNLEPEDWMVGDTGHDVLAGKSLNIQTCSVTSGFLGKESLLKYGPDKFIGSISELIAVVR